MSKIALIQLHGYREVLSILPVAKKWYDEGNQVDFYVSENVAGLLSPCSYVTTKPLNLPPHAIARAQELASKGGYDSLVITQETLAYKPLINDVNNYQVQQWARVGRLKDFHNCPLIFDKRDTEGENQALSIHLPPLDGKPLLLVNLHSKRQPLKNYKEILNWIKETFSSKYQVFDIGSICCHNQSYLLAFLDKASLLITVDTLHLQLSYATNTPAIALVPDNFYCQSEPRNHWLAKVTYSEALSTEGKQKIIDATTGKIENIVRDTSKLKTSYILSTPTIQKRTEFATPEVVGNRENIIKLKFPQSTGFNPSIVPFNDGYIATYRYLDGFHADICHLDKDFNVVGNAVKLNIRAITDPRLFWHPDGKQLLCLYSTHNTGSNDEYIRIVKVLDLGIADKFELYEDYRCSPESLNVRQKNWNPFVIDGIIYLIGRINPHEIWRLEWVQKLVKVELESTHEWKHNWPVDVKDLRGNTNGISIGDKVLSVFHSVEWFKQKIYYDNGIYLFENKPPFKVIGHSNLPFLRGEDAIEPYARSRHLKCIFPISLIQKGDNQILVAFGDNDSGGYILKTNYKDLTRNMEMI